MGLLLFNIKIQMSSYNLLVILNHWQYHCKFCLYDVLKILTWINKSFIFNFNKINRICFWQDKKIYWCICIYDAFLFRIKILILRITWSFIVHHIIIKFIRPQYNDIKIFIFLSLNDSLEKQ